MSVRKVEDFTPYRLLLFLLDRLEGISQATGYNCNPLVTTVYQEYAESSVKHTLFVDAGGEMDPVAHGVGGAASTVQEQQEFTIIGVSKFETEHPRRLAMALEQDVRRAIHSGMSDIRSWAARGASLRFAGCTHDGGYLAPDKEAGFVLRITFTWSQDSNW